jgi:dipeptidyl aminopeptidase/acylaminoacyl peptidase
MNRDYNWPTKDPLIKQNMEREIVPLTTAELEKRSPILFTKFLQAPILILHGQRDKTVSSQQAVDLATELEKNGKEHKLILIENADHGVGNPQIFKDYIWPFFAKIKGGDVFPPKL